MQEWLGKVMACFIQEARPNDITVSLTWKSVNLKIYVVTDFSVKCTVGPFFFIWYHRSPTLWLLFLWRLCSMYCVYRCIVVPFLALKPELKTSCFVHLGPCLNPIDFNGNISIEFLGLWIRPLIQIWDVTGPQIHKNLGLLCLQAEVFVKQNSYVILESIRK